MKIKHHVNKPILFLLLFFVNLSAPCQSADSSPESDKVTEKRPRFELEEIVVTADREEKAIADIPRNVTVITADDIAQAPGNSVVDLLAREAGIVMRNMYGHDKNTGIDIRGMGAASSSNVIVMVDGFRLNSPDLAGPDFSTVDINQIERIEIIRGAGSVIYGNGAVGGVVNIISKKGELTPETVIYSSYGDYETYDSRLSTRGRIKALSYSLSGSYYETDGFRDNGNFRKKDGAIRLDYDPVDFLSFNLSAYSHKDHNGFPGSTSGSGSRVETNTPNDFGDSRVDFYSGGFALDLGKWGKTSGSAGFRDRNNDYILGYSQLLSEDEQKNNISEDSNIFHLDHLLPWTMAGLDHSLQVGVDYYETDYVSTRITQDERKNGDVEENAWFAALDLSLPADFSIHTGYRRDRFDNKYRNDDYVDIISPPPPPFTLLYSEWQNGTEEKTLWKNEAFDFGLVWHPWENTTFFASYAKSFRNPNIDELSLASADLHPQKGYHFDIGLKKSFGYFLETSITWFNIKVEDEIYYDDAAGLNSNYADDTKRRGVEIDLRLYPLDSVYIWGNYSYTHARFAGSDNRIPLVPLNSGTIGLEWQALDELLVAATGIFVGSCYDGNDQSNDRYDKIASYEVYDLKVTYTHDEIRLFAGVNNIFDEKYTTIAYSETYYPMPERNFYAGMEFIF
jgi:outer membrane receptor protein involved in Fe transport